MSAYRKFSDTWEDADGQTLGALASLGIQGGSSDRGQTLGALGTLGARPPAIRRQDDFHELPSPAPKVPKAPKVLSIRNPPAVPSEDDGSRQAPHGSPKLAKAPKVTTDIPLVYAKALAELTRCCPHRVDTARWQQCIRDAYGFLHDWAEQAEALGWTARDLFGLHQPPASPAPSYQRLSRYDQTGLIWLLQGCPVVALTEGTATIRMATGSKLTYRRHNKPAYGPLGDSIDDFMT